MQKTKTLVNFIDKEDPVVSYTSKAEIPVFSYLLVIFEGGLRFWVLGLRSSFSTHPFVVVVVIVQWKAARCRIHLRPVMVRYGLAKVLI